MSDALSDNLISIDRTHWMATILDAVDQAVHAASATTVDPSLLGERLARAAWWEGCPRAQEIMDAAGTRDYCRIPLPTPPSCEYEALLIAWPAGHVTPVHDHDGLWGMELVLDGVLQVEAFDLHVGDELHLHPRETLLLGLGDSTTFSEADYAHRCRNLSAHHPALSLHIYGGTLESYRAFAEEAPGQWLATAIQTKRQALVTD